MCPECDHCQKVKEITEDRDDREVYVFNAEHVPKGQIFTLLMQKYGGELVYLEDFRVKNGQLCSINGSQKKLSDVRLILDKHTYYPGETVDIYLVSLDEKHCVSTCIIPRPIEIDGKDGAQINILLRDMNCSLFLIEGSGFKPNESITARPSHSNAIIPVEVDSDGKFSHFLVGGPSLILKFDLVRECETIHIEVPWNLRALAKQQTTSGVSLNH